MKIIGLTANMGAGKSTAVELIKEITGAEVKLIKFAQPLYDVQEYFYERIRSVYKRPKTFIKDRKLLQFLGTEQGRSISETLWVDLWKNEVDNQRQLDNTLKPIGSPELILISDDTRFDNEGDAIKALGGTIIKITRHDNTKHADGGVGIVNHASEAGIDPKYVDFHIKNNGTLEEYKDSLTRVIKQIMGSDNEAVA